MAVIHGIVVDCDEPARQAAFWKAALGYVDRFQADDWYSLQRPDDAGPFLSFDKVPEGKVVKNRVHLDLRPEGRSRDAERERLEALGATTLRLVTDDPDDIHFIMADPEGNEFCLLEPLS
jgi:hypothetical protein